MAWREILIFFSCFLISAMAGFAGLFRSRKVLSPRIVVSTMLYSGFVGLTISLLWFNYFDKSDGDYRGVWVLIGICSLAGLAGVGGVSLIDYLVRALTEGGLAIRIHIEKDEDNDGDDDLF